MVFETLPQFSRGLVGKVGPKAAETLSSRLPTPGQGWRLGALCPSFLWARTGSPSFSLPAGTTEVADSGLRWSPAVPYALGHEASSVRVQKDAGSFPSYGSPLLTSRCSCSPELLQKLQSWENCPQTVPSSPLAGSRAPCLDSCSSACVAHVWSFFVICLLPSSARLDWHRVVFSSLPSIVGAQYI